MNIFAQIAELLTKDKGSMDGHWVTIDGAHVLIGSDGTILKGPAHLMGTQPKSESASSKVDKARKSAVLTNKAVQDKADEYEGKISKALAVPRTGDNSAFDLRNDDVGIEVKTMVTGKNDKITMNKTALGRKLGEAKDDGLKTFTVVADVRGGGAAKYFVSEKLRS